MKVAKELEVPRVFIHFFGDGRDTDPKSGAGYMEDLLGKLKEIGIGEIATVVGRYYIMDRDKRWDRVEIGMKGVVTGEGEESTDPVATIKERYSKGENDEFLKPIIVGGKEARVQGESTVGISAKNRSILTSHQTMIHFSSSTTVRIASERLPSFLEISTVAQNPTSPTPRTSQSRR